MGLIGADEVQLVRRMEVIGEVLAGCNVVGGFGYAPVQD